MMVTLQLHVACAQHSGQPSSLEHCNSSQTESALSKCLSLTHLQGGGAGFNCFHLLVCDRSSFSDTNLCSSLEEGVLHSRRKGCETFPSAHRNPLLWAGRSGVGLNQHGQDWSNTGHSKVPIFFKMPLKSEVDHRV